MPQINSFLHLHLGIESKGLEGLQCHYAVVDDWSQSKGSCEQTHTSHSTHHAHA